MGEDGDYSGGMKRPVEIGYLPQHHSIRLGETVEAFLGNEYMDYRRLFQLFHQFGLSKEILWGIHPLQWG